LWAILPNISKAAEVHDGVPYQHLGILDLENFVGKGKQWMNNAQVRIYELSKELNLENKELLAICDQLNIVVKSYSSKISEFDAGRIRLAAKKYASTNGIQQELAITSHQQTSPKTISPNRLAPIHKQPTLEINQPKILTNRPSQTPELSVTTSFQVSCLNIKTDSEKWGYVFLGSSAINSLISNFESQVVLESYHQAPSVDWQDPALLNLWVGLNKYTSTDASLRNFAANLRLAIDLASELGMVRPNHGLFGLAGWLQNTVASWITEVRTALAYASNIAMALTEAELAAQTYTQNSESLARLKSNHQQLLTKQQNLQQRIRDLQNRESEVSLAISDLDIWLSTANLNIVNVLTQCLQNR
jgi:hypothetical protein